MSRLGFVCVGILSALAWSAVASNTFAQCACNGSGQGFSSESAMSQASEADMLLDEPDNPAEIFNLTVVVQDKAIVTVNGEPTSTTGTVRNYIVRGLKPGKSYKYLVEGLLKNATGAEYYAKDEFNFKAGETKQVVLNLRRKARTAPAAPAAPAPAAGTPAAGTPAATPAPAK